MLRKLLKYDFKSVFKYWWIAGLTSLALSVLGGFCIKILVDANSDTVTIQPPAVLTVSATLLLMLSIIAIVAFALISMILVYVRFFQNFFTDQAYLTFTLPVKRTTHLNSKLILGTVTEIATMLVAMLNVGIMLVIGFAEQIFEEEFWKEFLEALKVFIEEVDGYFVIMVIESLLFLLLSCVFATLFTYACITFASMITKKAKVITAIGIYYGASGILSFVVQMLYLFGLTNITKFLTDLPEAMISPVVCLMGLVVLLFIAVFCTLLYTFEHWMLDRKLNLA
jgi:hypothetical protein